MRKNPGGKKTPTSLVLSSTGPDPEDSTEHFESSSACSPMDSPTEFKAQFEVSSSEARATVNIFDKLKLLKSRRKGIMGNYVMRSSFDDGHHTLLEHEHEHEHDDDDQADEPLIQPSFQDYEQFKTENGRYAAAGAKQYNNNDVEAGHTSVRLMRPHSNVFNATAQQPENGSFETILMETIGGNIVPSQDGHDGGGNNKRTSFLLRNDVGLDEDFGDESEVYESRGTCQDDTASLYSDNSGMSAEADTSGSSQVDQNKKGRSSSSRPHHDRK